MSLSQVDEPVNFEIVIQVVVFLTSTFLHHKKEVEIKTDRLTSLSFHRVGSGLPPELSSLGCASEHI